MNSTYAKLTGIHFAYFKADRDVPPGFDTDPQALINKSLPEYDIFLGILWHTFGTPTPRAGSGTFEEFTAAKARYDEDPEKHTTDAIFQDVIAIFTGRY